jgi:hypothetical protein
MKDIRQQWKALASTRKITTKDIAALCVYRALLKMPDSKPLAITRLNKSFKPISNPVKIVNGADPHGALLSALRMTKYSSVYSWLDEEDAKKLYDLSIEISKEKFE